MSEPDEPGRERLILAVIAVTGCKRACETRDDLEIAAQLQSFRALILREVEPVGGRLARFIGDGALVTFPLRDREAVMRRLRGLKAKAHALWQTFDRVCTVHVKAGIGDVLEEPLAPGDVQLDEVGTDVNTLFQARGARYEVDGGLLDLPPG